MSDHERYLNNSNRNRKADRSQVPFSDEFDKQINLGFGNTLDFYQLAEGSKTYTIEFQPLTIDGKELYVSHTTNTFADGDVVELNYVLKAGLSLVTAKAMFKAEDEARLRPEIEKSLASIEPFTLDYLDENEPDYHGVTIDEEKEKQDGQ
ncbi:hypothetical protein [Streptococcus merionis]|uniref:Uncharacterized protein n=1 Tax=Streptococcus merionis TaxID=400065 RepID=A0A239SPU5_9STRE|nr:hypothetical protein [Streptococcus merionis]SNU87427.1 Uncharacterised protein [Streptococcus merionis]